MIRSECLALFMLHFMVVCLLLSVGFHALTAIQISQQDNEVVLDFHLHSLFAFTWRPYHNINNEWQEFLLYKIAGEPSKYLVLYMKQKFLISWHKVSLFHETGLCYFMKQDFVISWNRNLLFHETGICYFMKHKFVSWQLWHRS